MTIRAHSRNDEPWVLGLSASHNGAACLLHGDRVVAAIQEERLSRFKRDRISGSIDSLAVTYCLQAAGIRPGDLDMVVLSAQQPVHTPVHDLAFNRQLALVARKVPWGACAQGRPHATALPAS